MNGISNEQVSGFQQSLKDEVCSALLAVFLIGAVLLLWILFLPAALFSKRKRAALQL